MGFLACYCVHPNTTCPEVVPKSGATHSDLDPPTSIIKKTKGKQKNMQVISQLRFTLPKVTLVYVKLTKAK